MPAASHRRLAAPALALALLSPLPAPAQDSGAPMSAIDWLSDSVAMPAAAPGAGIDEPAVTPGATVDPVAVAPLDGGNRPDAIGILSPAVTGLPANLWGSSGAEDLARRVRALAPDMLPALQALLYTILLAELDPPVAPGGKDDTLFLARVDKLLELGALDQANALLERAGPDKPEIFRRWFDVALLIGEEQALCETMAGTPDLSPTYQARIFCLARAGDWTGASLLLGTGSALGLIPEDDADLFARFLDPDLFEGEAPLPLPLNPSPLTFRMFEAIGDAIPTAGLPLAFAQTDLLPSAGWKARIEAGERLARTGAVSDNQLLGLYTERRPAASGGVWDRVAAIQALEANMAANHHAGTAAALPAAWAALQEARVEVPIARIHGAALAGMALDGEAGRIAFHMGLLSDSYETVALAAVPDTPLDSLLAAIAQGSPGIAPAPDARSAAVQGGFAAAGAPVRLASLVDSGRLGEAILRAMTLLSEGASGDLDQVTDALALLRAVGLEDTARRTALEFLILDRRG
ncbi:hypothetical protein [Sinisalibacter aestuarii]|uniref:Sel1 repeat family protein n=1 Tax=Sinisalibacter aestuarii TaxID=2949426 RepID=A0ABQ5LZC8_9RHOB|nr:hypothetical protein [Sinisalibacter aestuarii]GKY89785.1 hypothetical protein STA1M1_36540 [Sinisalibacter aestuarii]